MIGLFLRNSEKEVCFAQVSKEQDIASFHYASDAKMMSVTMADGTEETITSEIAPEIHEVLLPISRILTVQLDDEGLLEREYWAEFVVS